MTLPSAIATTGAPCHEAMSEVSMATDHDVPFAVIWSRLMLWMTEVAMPSFRTLRQTQQSSG